MVEVKSRIRLTEESIANIRVAQSARIQKQRDGTYAAEVRNKYGKEPLRDGRGLARYPKASAAKQAIRRHNADIKFEKETVLPSPSMRPSKKH